MPNAFEILGLPTRLDISDEQTREAFREAGKLVHPDAGGEETAFAALRESFVIVSSPSRRLRHWLEWKGEPVEPRGTIDGSLMELFSEVGAVTQQAEAMIRKRAEAKSALGRAMLEGAAQECTEAVEAAISRVEEAIRANTGTFGELDAGRPIDREETGRLVRDLAFLEKWRAGLRSCYARLV